MGYLYRAEPDLDPIRWAWLALAWGLNLYALLTEDVRGFYAAMVLFVLYLIIPKRAER